MARQHSTSGRPKPTPAKPNPKIPPLTSQEESNSPSQSGTNRRQTRQVTALANEQQHKTVNFVSGGTLGNGISGNDDRPIDVPDRPAAPGRVQAHNSHHNRAVSKRMRKKAGAPIERDEPENTNAAVSTAKKPHQPSATPAQVKTTHHVKTRTHLENGTDGLDQVPYRFEDLEPPGGSLSPEPPHSQPTLPLLHPAQPTPQQIPPTVISQLIPGLQPPDPNNIYDQLRYFEGATAHLLQSLAGQHNPGPPPQHKQPPQLQPSASGPSNKRTKKKANPSPIQSNHHPRPEPTGLSLISKPGRDDTRPLDLTMGLDGRHEIYIRIRGRVRKILLNTGIDWSKRWPQVPAREKAMLYEAVRNDVPYMARFEGDWATARIASSYAAHLRSDARKHKELDPDPRYVYLKANSAKRRPDARRGARPGLAKSQGRADTDNHGGQGSVAGPSSSPNVNTAGDEEVMNRPGLFGSGDPSDDENESSLDEDPDFEKHE